jgi:replicative DNA helicase
MDEIFSLKLELHALGGLAKHPGIFPHIDGFVSEYDFYNDTHQTIFCVIQAAYLANEKLDKVLLAQKITNLGVNFKDGINIFDYIETIYFTQITEDATVKAFQELVKLRVLREMCASAEEAKAYVYKNRDKELQQIISNTDNIWNKKLIGYQKNKKRFVNIYEDIEDYVEGLGNDFVNKVPPKETPLMGPFPRINGIYGSLLRKGAITLVGSRTGVGKTSLGLFYLTYVAAQHNLPILHLDFGEMTPKELQIRSVCMFTQGKVPFHAVETGEWRANQEWVTLVRSVWPIVKKLRVQYEDISGLNPEEILSLMRRYSYTEAGRGNDFLVHYDYLKPFNFDSRTPEYKEMGHFIQGLKSLITNEIPARVWTSLQLNRSGIVNNKTSQEVDDSENSFSMSDRIIQQTTHSFLMRPKLMDEITQEDNRFGNTVCKNMKARHLGRDVDRHFKLVKMPDGGFKRNYINLETEAFFFQERGDLHDMAQAISFKGELKPQKVEKLP